MDLADATLLPDDRPSLFGEGSVRDPIAEILDEASARGATHVHLDPDGDAVRVRMRIGGRLTEVLRLRRGANLDFERRGVSVATLDGRVVLHLAPRDARC